MRHAVFLGLLAVVALAPLPFASNRPWSWSLLSLLVGALTVLWCVAALRGRAAVVAREAWPFMAIFALIVAWIVVQASPYTPAAWHHPLWARASAALDVPLDGAISVDPEATWTALMRLLAYAGVFWLALQLGARQQRVDAALWTVALAGVAYSVYGLVIVLGGFDTILWYRRWAYGDSLTSTFVNRNAFASYAGLTLVVLIGLALDTVRRRPHDVVSTAGLRWLIEGLAGRLGLLLLMALIVGSALLLTKSRGGLISGVVGLAVLVLVFTTARGARPWVAPLALAAAGVFVLGLVGLSGEGVVHRLVYDPDVLGGRLTVYGLVFAGILDNPWLGAGYGTFDEAFRLIRDTSVETDLIYHKAHNSYLEFAYEAGVPAFALMIGLIAALALLCLRGARRGQRLAPCVAVAATALVATHALVDFSIQMPAVAVSYALLLGVGCAQALVPEAEDETG